MQVTPQLLEQFWPLTNVSLGEKLREVKDGREVGVINAIEGKFVYKIADNWKTKEALEKDLSIFEFLPKNGFKHIPFLLKTKNGKLFEQVEKNFIYVFEYVGHINPEPTVATWKKLGELTADLHLVKNYPHATEFRPASIIAKELVTHAKDLPFKEEYLKLVAELPSFGALPQALIHTDIAPDNSMQKENGDIVLIDLDDIGVGIRILDIAYPLIHQFISQDLEFSEEKARAFYNAYLSKIQLTDEEKSHFFPAALFFAFFYIVYGDTAKRWKRIQWAIANRALLESVFKR